MNTTFRTFAALIAVTALAFTGTAGYAEEAPLDEPPPLFKEVLLPESVKSPIWKVTPETAELQEVLGDTDDSSYVITTTPGEKLTFELTPFDDEVRGTYPLAVRVWIRGRGLHETANKNRSVGLGIRVLHQDVYEEHFERVRLTDTVEAYYAEWTENPATGSDWTWEAIETLQALLQSGKADVPDGGGLVSRLLVEVAASFEPDAGLLVAGPIFGAVTSSRIKAWVKTDGPSSVRVRYGTDETDVRENRGLTLTTAALETSDDGGNTATFTITGLESDRRYYFTVLVDGCRGVARIVLDAFLNVIVDPECPRDNVSH